MPDSTISNLNPASPLVGNELVVVVQSGETKRSTLQSVVEAVTLKRQRIVNDESDFPAPVGGVITLEDNVIYEIGDVITTANRFQLGVGTVITSGTALIASLIYTGVSPMFTGQQISMRTIVISCPNAPFLDLTGTGTGDYLLLNTVLVAQSTKYATVNNINDVNIINSGTIDIDDGITVQGVTNWNTFRIDGLNFQSSSASYVGLDVTGSLLSDFKVDSFVQTAPSGAVGFKGDAGSANITTGELASYVNGGFKGGMTPLSGVTVDDIRYTFRSNSGLEDSVLAANPFLTAETTVDIVTTDVFVKVNQNNWSYTVAKRLSVTDNGDIVNDLEIPVSIKVDGFITMEKVGGGSSFIKARLVKNDDPSLTVSSVTENGTASADPASITLTGVFTLQPNETISVYVANEEPVTPSDILVSRSNLTVLRLS